VACNTIIRNNGRLVNECERDPLGVLSSFFVEEAVDEKLTIQGTSGCAVYSEVVIMERRSLRANLVIFGGIDFGKQSKENLQGVIFFWRGVNRDPWR